MTDGPDYTSYLETVETSRLCEIIFKLRAALKEIAEHPHLTTGNCVSIIGPLHAAGMVDGHRCAAAIAKKALGGK